MLGVGTVDLPSSTNWNGRGWTPPKSFHATGRAPRSSRAIDLQTRGYTRNRATRSYEGSDWESTPTVHCSAWPGDEGKLRRSDSGT